MKNIFLLDMDDTLFDFKRTEQLNLTETLARFGIASDRQVWLRFHEINRKLWQAYERGEITKERIRLGRFEQLFEEYGYSGKIADVSEAYFENFKEICIPFEGAEKFLRKLSESGRVYIVTNGNTAIQKRHLSDAGFSPFIEDTFISDEIKFAKPSAEFAEYVKSHIAGFESGRAVWIGDSLTSDKECADLAAVDFILYAPDGAPSSYSGVTAKNYDEILEIIEKKIV
ncbi:MAG: HAD-IA family hydrolase [Clostridia bacterium]|nr:HAD-IA family hydrolase [Clostridia bacterium]